MQCDDCDREIPPADQKMAMIDGAADCTIYLCTECRKLPEYASLVAARQQELLA